MTPTWIALLRGLNVGGHRISNADLRRAFEAMGCQRVATFRASGNVIFDGDGDGERWIARIEDGLQATLGYAVPTYLRGAAELQAVSAQRPFSESDLAASKGKPQVMFLAAAPDESARSAVLALSTPQDRLRFGERELFWLPAGGVLDTALDMKAIVRHVGVGTTRTLGTVDGIVKKLNAP